MRGTHGFILIMTLLMILVSSMLVVAGMQYVLIYYKAVNHQERQHRNFYQLEHVALGLADGALSGGRCVRGDVGANAVLKFLEGGEGCVVDIDGVGYGYLVEDLGEFPCLVVEIKGRARSTHHFRVSVLEPDSGAFLQIRSIKRAEFFSCQGLLRWVGEGVSSWRYLNLR